MIARSTVSNGGVSGATATKNSNSSKYGSLGGPTLGKDVKDAGETAVEGIEGKNGVILSPGISAAANEGPGIDITNCGAAIDERILGPADARRNGEKDGTGLSDDDKDLLLSQNERTKGDYKNYEEDVLFKKVSKAYVKNLKKVLVKIKK